LHLDTESITIGHYKKDGLHGGTVTFLKDGTLVKEIYQNGQKEKLTTKNFLLDIEEHLQTKGLTHPIFSKFREELKEEID